MKSQTAFSNDFDLIDGIRSGNRDALQQFYEVQYRSLRLYAFRILGDRDLAEDVVADSFARIWQRRNDFDDLRSFVRYLFTTTRNDCFDQLARSKRIKMSHHQIAYLADRNEEVNHNKLVRTELLRLILSESDNLPPRLHEVFKQIFLEGLTLPDTAEKLGVSFNTIKTQRKVAVQKIREGLQKKGISGRAMSRMGL